MSDADNVADLLATLDLVEEEPRPDEPESRVFTGPSQYKPDGRVFGGQVLAQCVVAAGRTVDPERPIHSLHGYFLRGGDVREPISFGVEVLRDGGSFSARRIHAYQKGRPIMSTMASFQSVQDGLDHQDGFPPDVPGPEDCTDIRDLIGAVDIPQIQEWIVKRPFDIRPVEPPIFFHHHGEKDNRQHVWFRTTTAFSEDPLLNSAALVYASDYNLFEPTLRRHGLAWATPGLRLASLDHAMWLHRPIRVDEWMLYSQTAPSAQGGRALGAGKIYAQDGTLLASVAQEGMVRIKPQG